MRANVPIQRDSERVRAFREELEGSLCTVRCGARRGTRTGDHGTASMSWFFSGNSRKKPSSLVLECGHRVLWLLLCTTECCCPSGSSRTSLPHTHAPRGLSRRALLLYSSAQQCVVSSARLSCGKADLIAARASSCRARLTFLFFSNRACEGRALLGGPPSCGCCQRW